MNFLNRFFGNNNTNKLVVRKVFEGNDELYAIVIDGVFSEQECKEWIELTESRGYEVALVNVGGGQQMLMTDIRNNDRCIIDDEEMASKIYDRIKPFIPETYKTDWKKISLNERLRFLRYYVGQEFKMHRDGCYVRETGPKKGEQSFITCQLYLNNVEEGGETTFFVGGKEIHVSPKTGSVLLFQHNILHQGSSVIKGTKYVVRTDVMYKK